MAEASDDITLPVYAISAHGFIGMLRVPANSVCATWSVNGTMLVFHRIEGWDHRLMMITTAPFDLVSQVPKFFPNGHLAPPAVQAKT